MADSNSFTSHFIELRSRLLNSLIFIFIIFIISYIFAEQIYNFLVEPYAKAVKDDQISRRLIFTALHETFITYLKVAFFSAIFLGSPVLLIQIYKFIAPGLYKNEKKALLPYYGNDESLYNKRVTIVDSSGERTLKFFNKATEKDNVLAIVFQDEAQPDYHLPNFNKSPEGHYKEDLNKLKSNLNGRKGIYRGIMFQVGEKNFSRSFKEFVENAWQGQGYLKSDNLKKYC